MRQAVSQAGWHVAHRAAFGATLIDKPLMQNVLADLEIEVEAATLTMMRLSGAFDRAATDRAEAEIRRLATPIAKYWITKRCTEVVREALECLGGNGYVEESILSRLFRESPLNAIWEGSGNVIALDVLRVIANQPVALDVFVAELESASGLDTRFDHALTTLTGLIAATGESQARRLVEWMAVLWQASLLLRHGDPRVAEMYVTSRVAGERGNLFGTLPGETPVEIARRAVPAP
jgi:putative acyl-CoA dehydrogenase